MDSREVQELRPRRAHRDLRRALPHAQGAGGGAPRTDQVPRETSGATRPGRSDVLPAGGAAPDVPCLLCRRRRHRAARVRQLRHSGGLRAAGPNAGVGQGRDRNRALWRFVARHQAESRRRTRRRGLPHLLGPEGRWLRSGRRVPAGTLAADGRGATRQRDGHAGLSRRSAHARRRSHEGREAAVPPAGADDHQDSRAADLVRRCAAAARRGWRAYRARRLARRARDHLPRRPRAREGAPAGEVRLGHEDAVRRDRPHPRLRRAGRVDHPWQPPRRVGERRPGPAFRPGAAARGSAGVRDAPAAGVDAAPHDHLRRLGR